MGQEIFSLAATRIKIATVGLVIGLGMGVVPIPCSAHANAENFGTSSAIQDPVVSASQDAVPQVVLSLIHDDQVQKELGLSGSDIRELEQSLKELDRVWWPSRILPAAEQRTVVQGLETQLWQVLRQFPESATRRLQELERQAQGARVLLRADAAAALQLTDKQQRDMQQVAAATDRIAEQVQDKTLRGENSERERKELAKSRQAELETAAKLLSAEQQRLLKTWVGQVFPTQDADRIYPLAPELVTKSGTIGQIPAAAELQGKVVVVHFYAFQCINCQRNLPVYQEWVRQFARDDVIFIGIQTPETPAEADPDRVRAAAQENGMQYPVILDMDRKNWDAWGNTMWPTVYVIDRRGYIRSWWQGELKWQGAEGDRQIADIVRSLLDEPAAETIR